MSDISITPVPPAALIARWSQVSELLDKAMPVNLRRYESIDVLDLCIRGMAQGWMILEGNDLLAVIVTTIEQYPRRRGLNVFALSGSRMQEWFNKADEVLSAHALQNRCDHFQIQGRRGWEKVLDLEPRCTFLVKDLTVNKEEQVDGGAMN